jgi:hypothetical protein
MKRFRDTEYFVSEDGKVFRKWGEIYKELKQFVNEYKCVNIYTGSISSRKTLKVHRMVAECYLTNPNNKAEVNHKDTNKFNNSVFNLEWSTRKENCDHAKENLLYARGENKPTSKFKRKDIEYIRKNYIPKHKKYGARALSREFNVSIRTMTKIIHNISYN